MIIQKRRRDPFTAETHFRGGGGGDNLLGVRIERGRSNRFVTPVDV